MPHIQIKNISGATLHEGDYPDTRAAVVDANLAKANIFGANLIGTNLGGADLFGANLAKATLAKANLGGADLAKANLVGACLFGANLVGAILRDGSTATAAPARRATRSDGFEFFLWPTSAGWRVAAGCRFFTMDEAWKHWEKTRGDTPLGNESLDILTMFELHIQRVGGGYE